MRSEAEIREIQRGAEAFARSFIANRETDDPSFAASAVIDDILAWVLEDAGATERTSGMLELYREASAARRAHEKAQRQ